MSFLDRARQAAEQARLKAAEAAGSAREAARPAVSQAQASSREAAGSIREAAGSAKKGLSTVVERIDPGLLADVVIKATALQERANESLRQKRSPYRISEIVITATIPPQLSFSIARIGDVGEQLTGGELDSSEIVEDVQEAEAPILTLAGDNSLMGAGAAEQEAAIIAAAAVGDGPLPVVPDAAAPALTPEPPQPPGQDGHPDVPGDGDGDQPGRV
jgi:hypothetical protein